MKKAMRREQEKQRMRLCGFRSRPPLPASLGASLIMRPISAFASGNPRLAERKTAVEQKKPADAGALVESLAGTGMKAAVRAGQRMIGLGSRAMPAQANALPNTLDPGPEEPGKGHAPAREMAESTIIRINKVYRRCENRQNSVIEQGILRENAEIWGETYVQKAA